MDEKAKQMMELSTEVNQLNEDRCVKIYSLFRRSGLGKSVLLRDIQHFHRPLSIQIRSVWFEAFNWKQSSLRGIRYS